MKLKLIPDSAAAAKDAEISVSDATFAREYDDVLRLAPRDLIMTETDSPFAAPVPHRGKRNEPLYVKYVVEAIAKVRAEDPEDVRRYTVKNAERIFGLS